VAEGVLGGLESWSGYGSELKNSSPCWELKATCVSLSRDGNNLSILALGIAV